MATRQYDAYVYDADDAITLTEPGAAVSADVCVTYDDSLKMEEVLATLEKIKIRILNRGL